MMCEKHPSDPAVDALLERANVVITALFALEMGLKLMALSLGGYWDDPFNRFDGFIVLASSLEVASESFDLPINTQVLRAFRILRVFKLLRSWRSLQKLLMALIGILSALLNLIALLTLILFIFGLLGMQIFGNRFAPPDFPTPPRANFDSIANAMLTSTIVATGESWNERGSNPTRPAARNGGLTPTRSAVPYTAGKGPTHPAHGGVGTRTPCPTIHGGAGTDAPCLRRGWDLHALPAAGLDPARPANGTTPADPTSVPPAARTGAAGTSSIVFFVPLVVFANYMLLNLVVALLLGSFQDADASGVCRAASKSPRPVGYPPPGPGGGKRAGRMPQPGAAPATRPSLGATPPVSPRTNQIDAPARSAPLS
eukprot:3338276-Prymnesium_polylepis.1